MFRTRSHLLPVVLLLVAVALAACSSAQKETEPSKGGVPTATPSATGTVGQASHSAVEITDSGFKPDRVEVKVGQAVVWVNSTKTQQRISIANGPESPAIAPGNTAKHVFDKPGTYSYSDPVQPSFEGTVVVR